MIHRVRARHRLLAKGVLAALFLAALVPSDAVAMPPSDAQAWREDLRYMAEQMALTHKNLYHAVSRDSFAAMVRALDAKIPSLERNEVIVAMAQIVAAVGDGHTNIYPTRDAKIGFHTLPVAFAFFGDSLFVRAATESQRALVGTRVLRIGDRDVADAYAAVKTMIGRDNEQGARYWAPYLLAMPEVLEALHITRTPEDVTVKVATKSGTKTVTFHQPFALADIMSGDIATLFDHREGWVDVRDLSGRPDPVWLQGAGQAFRFEHVGDLLYVQINTIGNAPNETLGEFSRRLHDEIAATKPAKVAIDLRLNRGGDASFNTWIVRTVIESESIDQEGRLFVIIGPVTFSAAQMLCDALERYTNVTFVGEPTGSKGNAYGDSRKIILPRSGVTVRASIFYWQNWDPRDTRDATAPQIPAPLTFDAYRHNIDPALEAVKQAKPTGSHE